MYIEFSELIDFCFNDLSDQRKSEVEFKVFTDENYLLMVRGINQAKNDLGSKAKVRKYFCDSSLSEGQNHTITH